MNRIGAVFIALSLLATNACAAPPSGETADTILVNGAVYTVDESQPWAEAVAIAGERILAVGANADIESLAGPSTRTIDLNGPSSPPASTTATCTSARPGRC